MKEIGLGHKLGTSLGKYVCEKCGTNDEKTELYQNEHLEDVVVSGVYIVTKAMIDSERKKRKEEEGYRLLLFNRMILETYRQEMQHYCTVAQGDACKDGCSFCTRDRKYKQNIEWRRKDF